MIAAVCALLDAGITTDRRGPNAEAQFAALFAAIDPKDRAAVIDSMKAIAGSVSPKSRSPMVDVRLPAR